LAKLTEINPGDADAHHIFPQALQDIFEEDYGIDIHDPEYGEWWNSVEHGANSAAYQQDWEEFLGEDPPPSLGEVFQFAQEMLENYNVSF
jgi:hypothetical protein